MYQVVIVRNVRQIHILQPTVKDIHSFMKLFAAIAKKGISYSITQKVYADLGAAVTGRLVLRNHLKVLEIQAKVHLFLTILRNLTTKKIRGAS